jgi:hypothetical protein
MKTEFYNIDQIATELGEVISENQKNIFGDLQDDTT